MHQICIYKHHQRCYDCILLELSEQLLFTLGNTAGGCFCPFLPHLSFLPPFLPLSLFSLSLAQSCLKGLYLNWLTDSSPLQEIVAHFLTSFTLPPLNCLPITKPVGQLGDIILPPIHEESSLPYTSTGAFKLLQSIGESIRTYCGLVV